MGKSPLQAETVSEFWRWFNPTQHRVCSWMYRKLGGMRSPIASVLVPWLVIEGAYDLLFEALSLGHHANFLWTTYGAMQALPTIVEKYRLNGRAKKKLAAKLDDLVEHEEDALAHFRLDEESRDNLEPLLEEYDRHRGRLVREIYDETQYGLLDTIKEYRSEAELTPKAFNIARTMAYVVMPMYWSIEFAIWLQR